MENTFTPTIMMIIKLVAPIIVALTCIFILTCYRNDNRDSFIQLITKVLILQLIACVVSWLCSICFWGATSTFVYMQWLFVPSILYSQIMTYRYIFLHTATQNHEHFSLWHYLWPFIPAMFFFISIFIYPQSIREHIVSVRPPIKELPHYYNIITQTVPFLFILTNILYSVFGLYRISLYRKAVVDFSADESRTSVKWLKQLVYITLASVPLGIVSIILGTSVGITLFLSILGVTAVILKGVIPIHNIMNTEYVLMYPVTGQTATEVKEVKRGKASMIKIEIFERYMSTQKPYLNPDLRITDLLVPLGTNRTYLSAFINTQYGVNFSRYINNLRLKELERRRNAPEDAHIGRIQLVEEVGFRSYRNYLNCKLDDKKKC
ncbi:MAG: hypothetical protein ACRDDZ_10665 [Marinifilaceae bacterium]